MHTCLFTLLSKKKNHTARTCQITQRQSYISPFFKSVYTCQFILNWIHTNKLERTSCSKDTPTCLTDSIGNEQTFTVVGTEQPETFKQISSVKQLHPLALGWAWLLGPMYSHLKYWIFFYVLTLYWDSLGHHLAVRPPVRTKLFTLTSHGGGAQSQHLADLLRSQLLHQQVDEGWGILADKVCAVAGNGREEWAHLVQSFLYGHLNSSKAKKPKMRKDDLHTFMPKIIKSRSL